jgi:type VI secretion system protein ImpJ
MIPIMGPYDHNDIDGSIYPLMSLIEKYISVVDRGFSVVAMHKKERFFYHYITEKDINSCKEGRLYVGVKGIKRDAYHDVETWMTNAIIVSDSAVENVREKRVKGASRRVANENMISEIMPGSGTMLFEVLIDHNFIKGEQNLHIFNPGDTADTRPIEVNLYIPREKVE